MNFKQIATVGCLTASISFGILFGIESESHQSKSYISLLDNNSVKIETDNYLSLIDGRIDRLESNRYTIRRRYSSTPLAKEDNTDLYILYLDVYNRKGTLIGTRTHNLPVSKS